jgi:SSS family solute:Na+ symporter
MALGDGSAFEGMRTILTERPESLATLATINKSGESASVPWPTLLTGMMFIQIFYWSTNQVIVQRALAARSLAEGQKGVLFAATMKLVGPLMLCLPGIIALHMVAELGITADDQVYPAVVRHVLPDWSLGLFGAVLVGAILSSFNSALNSAATLFCIDFYGPLRGDRLPESVRARQTVRVGQAFATLLAIGAMVVAPMLAQMESIFAYLQKINGLYSVPIIAIFFVGILSRRAPAIGAKWAMGVGIIVYGVFTFFEPIEGLHWLHGYFISTVLAVAVLLVFAQLCPRTDEQMARTSAQIAAPVDMTPWRFARAASAAIVFITIAIYITLQWLSAS